MTAGFAILKSIKKKWSVGDTRVSQKKGGNKTTEKQRRRSRKESDGAADMPGSLEIVAPSTSDVEFKFDWSVAEFIKQVKTCKENGIKSKPFIINMNGICTEWNLSLQFWVDGQGCRLTNPVVICLNLVSWKVATKQDVAVKFKFGIFNQKSQEFEMGVSDKASIMLEEKDKLQSVGYKNIAISDKHVNRTGDVVLSVRLSLIQKEVKNHSLSSDLSNLLHDKKSADCVLQAGDRTWVVHSNILAARSPVFAKQLSELQEDYSSISLESGTGTDDDLEDGGDKKGAERKESVAKLVINDLPAETVEELLHYIYTDSHTSLSSDLLAASEQYQLPGLKHHCEDHLQNTITSQNVAQMLLLASQCKSDNLKKTALQFCGDNHSYIMKVGVVLSTFDSDNFFFRILGGKK